MQSAAQIICWTLVGIFGVASAQSGGSWLDRPAMNWNRRMGALPRPVSSGTAAEIQTRCRELIRQPENPAENALVRAGWRLYGDVRYYGPTKIVTALSGFDGMCRPLGYQAFVYWEGRYAGALSPTPMDSRTDGALVNTRLLSPARLMAEFVRYNASDPLCCPTRISYVTYEVSRDDAPLVAPVDINTSPVGAPAAGPDAGRDDSDDPGEAALYGRKWALTEVNGAAVRAGKPYIEFDREAKRFSGDSGCNRISGGFELNGVNLKFSRVISTRRACLDGEAQQVESNFLRSIEQTTRYRIRGDVLRLNAGGPAVLVFRSEAGTGRR